MRYHIPQIYTLLNANKDLKTSFQFKKKTKQKPKVMLVP